MFNRALLLDLFNLTKHRSHFISFHFVGRRDRRGREEKRRDRFAHCPSCEWIRLCSIDQVDLENQSMIRCWHCQRVSKNF